MTSYYYWKFKLPSILNEELKNSPYCDCIHIIYCTIILYPIYVYNPVGRYFLIKLVKTLIFQNKIIIIDNYHLYLTL